MNTSQASGAAMPIRHRLTLSYVLSVIIAVLVTAASLIGLLYRDVIYPAEDLLQSFVPTDAVNLLVGMPVFVGSMGLARRGKPIGLLLWPGALLFFLYNYLVYVLAMPLGLAFLLHLILLVLSLYTIISLVASIDGDAVQQRLTGLVPERLAGGILAGFGLLFSLRAVSVIVSAVASQAPTAGSERALLVADFVIGPALVIGGLLLWQRRELGYVTGLGLLFHTSMSFVGLVIFLLLQPFMTAAPFVLTDVVVILVMGLICFVPFALFVRGVVSLRRSLPE
jgi:hypothetical protein